MNLFSYNVEDRVDKRMLVKDVKNRLPAIELNRRLKDGGIKTCRVLPGTKQREHHNPTLAVTHFLASNMPSIAPGAVMAFEEGDDSTTFMRDSPTSERTRASPTSELKVTTASKTAIFISFDLKMHSHFALNFL